MPCHAAIDENFITTSPDTPVEDVLKQMKKKKTGYACITNENHVFVGWLSYSVLIKNLLPVSISTGDTFKTDITLKAAPGIAKRLKKVAILPVSHVMERKAHLVHPETPLWEGIGTLVDHGEPLIIVEEKTHKLIGLVTNESAIRELQRLGDTQ